MKTPKKTIENIKKLNTKDKALLIVAVILTVSIVVTIPVMAWFSRKKQIATMAKINSPAKISIKSGAKEDLIQFKLSDIDAEAGNTKDFVFCVEGEDINYYKIQLAHTTNINFTYEIYQATSDTTGVQYVKENRDSVYYRPAETALSGVYINRSTENYTNPSLTRNIGTTAYQNPSYNNGSNPDARQAYAEPLYWQTANPIIANDDNYDEDDSESSFLNYYVLRITWGDDVKNDKETDLIYITAQVT